MPPGPSSLSHYLTHYGLACELPKAYHQVWQRVVIVPVCGESADCLERLTRLVSGERYLIIVCLNRPEGHLQSDSWSLKNHQFKVHLEQQALISHRIDSGFVYAFDGYDVWLLDFNDQPFNANQGVGLARKIAADSALALIEQGVVKDTWIFSTDADVQLPKDYFNSPQNNQFTAYSLAFQHVGCGSELSRWQAWYDFKLHYYQQGMRHIGTPYDYIPLGSCLVLQAGAYAKVRGFPKRSGGEDFYVLNKLAKLGPIAQPDKPVVRIKTRLSERVPFGTGPAVQKIKDSPETIHFYHPQIFAEIKVWYQQLLNFFEQRQNPASESINQSWSIERVLNRVLAQIKTAERWQQFVLEWFDAFRLLKTVHHLEATYPRLPLDKLKDMDLFNELTEGLELPE